LIGTAAMTLLRGWKLAGAAVVVAAEEGGGTGLLSLRLRFA